ncbi:type II secretion system F family protein [Rhodococcus sp. NPDC003322]
MTAALMVAAVALLVVPASPARHRLRSRPDRHGAVHGALPRIGVTLAASAVAAATVVEPAAGAATAMVLGTVGYRVRRSRRTRRRAGELRTLLAALEVVIADLRVGAHPEAACNGAADETRGSVAQAFRSAAATARLGGSAAQGLVAGGRRGESGDADIASDLDRIAAAWKIAERHGIALADLLEAARADLLGRIRFRTRVESGMAGARATAAVLAGLPLLGVGLGQMMGAGPVRVLLSGGLGGILLVVGTALACAGLAWADRITTRATA